MKEAFLYCNPNSLNDATNHYIDIVLKALGKVGFNVSIVHRLKDITNADLIFTVSSVYFFYAKIRFPFVKTICWKQGVNPEESNMYGRGKIRYYWHSLNEWFALKTSDMMLLVSKKMLQHYQKKYCYNRDNYIIMPCYNLSLSNVFETKRYEYPTFVYAGNASIWQNAELMLDVYKKIEQLLPQSTFTILTNDNEKFLDLITERGIKNVTLKYVPMDKLSEELRKYKYGFLLREDNIVNNVATPTKMNSYLSNYLIPIFTDSVDDFRLNIHLGEFTLMAECPLSIESITNKVISFENTNHNYLDYRKYVQEVFDKHYNDDYYMKHIKEKLIELHML